MSVLTDFLDTNPTADIGAVCNEIVRTMYDRELHEMLMDSIDHPLAWMLDYSYDSALRKELAVIMNVDEEVFSPFNP